MKPIIPLLLLLCFVMGCKKGAVKEPEPQLYSVALKLTTAAKVPDPEGTKVDYLYYHLYNESKVFVKSRNVENFHSGDILRDTLPDGKYTALIAIGYQALTHNVHEAFSAEAYANELVYYYSDTNPDRRNSIFEALNFSFHDFYTVRYEFTVSGGHQSDVILQRAPALVSVDIQDAIPANVDTIAVDVKNESTLFYSPLQAPDPANLYALTLKIRRNAAQVRSGKKINFYVINTVTPLTYTTYGITAAKDTVFKTTVSSGTLLKRNDAITLSGRLFTPGSPPFVINANSTLHKRN